MRGTIAARVKMSGADPLLSGATRFVAVLSNATYRPSSLSADLPLNPFARSSWGVVLAISVRCDARSRTKTSSYAFVSPGTRLVANELKLTREPSALIEGSKLKSFALKPDGLRLSSVIAPVSRSATKMSQN